ncbi:MAG: HD domain-containing protein [Acidimicrobiia bacterium]
MTDRLQQQLDFLMEIDRLKSVNRQTLITDRSRRENTAEHSWHLAMFAFVLAEYANEDVDLLHVLQLCLIHDIVEIDAGDTFAYDTTANSDKDEREQRAADRLFGLLPADQHARLRALWEEYEAMETAESRFANAVDRMQPAMLNHMVGEMSTWREHGISEPQAVKRLSPIGEGSDRLWQHTREMIAEAVRRGNLTEG